ncbi:hypothetical protein [Kutzneria sp. NPDC052558]|uniref:hypothetical protein n=1 Tax=Kutzneria sp. NPDC052558 TaxID=3364121 RepID=UPI0037C892FA
MVRFHVIVNPRDRVPTAYAVVRGDEIFTYDLRWRRSDLRRRLRHWEARPVGVDEAEAAVEQIIGDVRRADQAAWINRTHRYYRHEREVLRATLAARDTVAYERFAGEQWWPAPPPTNQLTEVDVDDAEEYKARWNPGDVAPEPPRPFPVDPGAEKGAEEGRYVVSMAGDDQPLAVVLTNNVSRERLTTFDTPTWDSSDLLGQIAAGRFDWTVREVDGKQSDAALFAIGRARHRADESRWIDQELRYYFVVDTPRGKDTVTALVRVHRQGEREEYLSRDGQWLHSTYLMDADHGGWDYYLEVTEADARRYQAGWYRRTRGAS